MEETSEQFSLMKSPNQICSAEDFLVQLSQLLEKEQDSQQKILEVASFLKFAESCGVSISHTFFLRTSKDFSTMTQEELSQSFSPAWMNWGMTHNGNVLTARILESRSTEKESLLSEILEENPDQKYFLSEGALERKLIRAQKHKDKGNGFIARVYLRSTPTTIKEVPLAPLLRKLEKLEENQMNLFILYKTVSLEN
jgi:hypothetical protein